MSKDLTYGEDVRGDRALFIHVKHFLEDDTLDDEAKEAAGDGAHFFRLIDDDGERHAHGWVEDGEIIQWG